ncbi:sugar ABC transporter substrate-binding protein [Diplocloster modestus]|uniref:Extracellular solute-binding protein n=1 Tax=Diplocloster modestus TaxID=2850322 RepID=A0ABS6K4M8_9FIRM|nr:extracellular solute-binding protein [Diplocloster modestus]MBU9725499.1 extracellular solute-binding protein [Diplocloster modestus]
MKQRKLWALLLAATLLMSMTGCGSSGESGGEGTQTPAADSSAQTETPADASGEGRELICWTILNPESDADPRNVAFKKILDDWNANNEYGAKMTVVSVNWADLHTQFTQAAAAGNAPDVVCAFSTNLDQYIAAGGLQPMTEYATKWINETDDYIYTAKALTKTDGEIYSLPWETRCMLLYYRADIYGEEAPFQSLQDIVDKAGEFTGNGNYGFVLGCHGDDGFLQQLTPVLYAFGASVYDKDMNIVLNSDEGAAAIEWLRDLYNAGVMDNAAVQMNIEDTFNAMKAGTAYSIILGSHRYGALAGAEGVGENIRTCAIPGVADGSVAPAYDTSQTLGIGKECKYPEIAFDFITANLTAEASSYYYEASCMPVRTSVYDMESVKGSAMYDTMSEWSKIWESGLDNFFFEPDYNAEFSTAVAEAVQELIINGGDVKATLDEVVSNYQ